MKKTFATLFSLMAFSSAYAGINETLICAGGNIEVTYKAGFWPLSSDRATFKDQVRKLNLKSDFSVSAHVYNIENENWLTDGDIVFQLNGTKNGEVSYEPYILLLNSEEMKRVQSGSKVTIGFSTTIPEKIKEYRCSVK